MIGCKVFRRYADLLVSVANHLMSASDIARVILRMISPCPSAGSEVTALSGDPQTQWKKALPGYKQPLGLHPCCHEFPFGWQGGERAKPGVAGIL